MRKGFTLIELSVSLVVTTLLAITLLSAKDLIRATQVRSVISDIHGFKTSLTGFQLLYRRLPGDLNIAHGFWPNLCNDDGSNPCNGNADGQIAFSVNEGLRAWQHLALAEILPGQYTGTLDKRVAQSNSFNLLEIFVGSAYAGQQKTTICHNGHSITVANPAVMNGHLAHGDTIGSCEGTGGEDSSESTDDYGKFTVGWNIPASRIEPAGYKMDWNEGNLITFAAERNPNLDASAINPREAWNIDKKVDDGSPSSGAVLSADGYGTTGCINESGYNLGNEEISCQMHFWINNLNNNGVEN